MAEARKPRIRKTAPTVRERMEATQSQEPKAKLPKIKPRLHLPQNKVLAKLAVATRPIRRVLGWLMPRYFINAWREVRQVTWTTRKETWRLTLAVFIFAIVFGALVAGVDKGLDEAFRKLVLK